MEHVHESGGKIEHDGHEGHAHDAGSGDGANVLKDPVCGMTVTESSPHQVDHAGQRYYFCSEECKQTFDANRSYYKSESAFQVAEQKAMSLCRWDKHKNGGVEFGAKTASKS